MAASTTKEKVDMVTGKEESEDRFGLELILLNITCLCKIKYKIFI